MQIGVIENCWVSDTDTNVLAEFNSRTCNWFVKLIQKNNSDHVQSDSPELVEIVVQIVVTQVDVHTAVVLQNLLKLLNFYKKIFFKFSDMRSYSLMPKYW